MKTATLTAVFILLAVICLADETEKKKDVASFREAVEWFGKGPHAITTDEAFSAIRKRAENCNLTQAEAIAEMTALAREYRKLSEDFSEGVTDRRRVNEERRTRREMSLIANFGDHSTLPFFEEMTGASNGSTRVYAVRAYIQVAGVDAVSFIKNFLDDDRLNSMDHWKIYETLGKQIEIAVKKGNINIDPCQRFLLEETKKEHTGDGGKQLDIILSKVLPDYTNSIQRIEAAQWFVQNGSSYHKNYFGNIKTEIEKTPKEKRKDFRAKDELLDPGRSK